MRVELTEGLGFSAAHFIIGHKKCEYLHGHNWRVGVTVEGEEDERGLVVDFLDLKRMMEKICNTYDHRLLLPSKNPAIKVISEGKSTRIAVHGREFEFPSSDVVWIPAVNTTVEEFARVLADEIVKSLSGRSNVRSIKVFVEESPGQSATEERQLGRG
ncbi:6-carboxytetrahydropterin synthase [Candidatus Bipolaricaulota bacterium]|nr:6-carboxytetrahydropterin synthase [Candidatus Bipolaricaulota bacterium]